MTQILPRRHLRLVQQVATRPHDTLQQLRHAHLPLVRVLVRPDVLGHLLRHVLDNLGRDHHVAAVEAAAVVRHLRELSTDTEDDVPLCHPVLEGGQPDRAALAQVRRPPGARRRTPPWPGISSGPNRWHRPGNSERPRPRPWSCSTRGSWLSPGDTLVCRSRTTGRSSWTPGRACWALEYLS